MKTTARWRRTGNDEGTAHSSLLLDVGVASTPIPHSNPISLYTTRRLNQVYKTEEFYMLQN